MTQRQSITLLGMYTTMANGDGQYEGYNRNQAVGKFINTRTNTATKYPGTYHLHL